MQKRIKELLAPIVFAAAIIFGIWIGNTMAKRGTSNPVINLSTAKQGKLSWIIDQIDKEYVDTIDRDAFVEEIIPDILEKLDPHTVYIPAKDLQEVNEQLDGSFGGIGVQFNIHKDTIIVVMVIAGGPSEQVGLHPGDRIVTVNDSTIAGTGITNNDVMKLLRGPKGTKVGVGIKRSGEPDLLNFEITRGNIPLYSVDVSYMLNDETGYIKVSSFGARTYQEFLVGITKLKKQGAKNMIVDLRGNQGGYLEAVARMMNEFLQRGDMIVYTEGKAFPRMEYKADGSGTCKNMNLVVLLDEYSASASEIFAGATQDNDRGVIVGRRSFGKGLVQNQRSFRDGSALRMTIARYYTASGRCIQKPYENGTEDYYHDIWNRYVHGELDQKDSVHINKNEVFKTLDGRPVYGGGGIMPDIFVPRDTTGYTDFLGKLNRKALVYRFALEFTDAHRAELENLERVDDILQFIAKNTSYNKFLAFAKKNDIKPEGDEASLSKNVITLQINAYVVRNILDNAGYYPVINKDDITIDEALEVLQNNREKYNRILTPKSPK